MASLSDDELLTEVKRLANTERRATAALVRSLMEVDARRLYLREGCSSLFTYCTQVLCLEEAAAYNRIEVARAARHRSKRDVERLIAALAPKPDPRALIRKLPARAQHTLGHARCPVVPSHGGALDV
jgi:hypothetical protein